MLLNLEPGLLDMLWMQFLQMKLLYMYVCITLLGFTCYICNCSEYYHISFWYVPLLDIITIVHPFGTFFQYGFWVIDILTIVNPFGTFSFNLDNGSWYHREKKRSCLYLTIKSTKRRCRFFSRKNVFVYCLWIWDFISMVSLNSCQHSTLQLLHLYSFSST